MYRNNPFSNPDKTKNYTQNQLSMELGITKSMLSHLHPAVFATYRNGYKMECNLYHESELQRLRDLPELAEMQNKKLKKEIIKTEKKETTKNSIVQNLLDSWYMARNTEYVIHVGPTNSGKTYHAVQDLKKSGNGLYLCPLRLLAWEIHEKLNNEGVPCTLRTGEEVVEVDGEVATASTIEMCNYKKRHDTVIIDECFMIGDEQRGKSWTKALMEVDGKTVHVITNYEAVGLIESILGTFNRTYTKIEYERLTPLEVQENDFSFKKISGKSILVCFSRIGTLIQKKLLEEKGLKSAVLYGNLPPHVKKEQIRQFTDTDIQFLVSTDVIGMGLNLPCDNVVFMEKEKFDGKKVRPLNSTEIKQIGGRAGRYLMSDKGRIFGMNGVGSKFLRNAFGGTTPVTKAYIGVDENMLEFVGGRQIKSKLKELNEMEWVDGKLKTLFEKEDLTPYFELLNFCPKINTLEWQLAWLLLTLPVKNTNISYWGDVVNCILRNKKISPPRFQVLDVLNIDGLETVEEMISRMDLFFYVCNRKKLTGYVEPEFLLHLEELKTMVQQQTDNINDFLVNRKLQNLKKCGSCKKPMGFKFQYDLCGDCYRESRSFNDYEEENFDYVPRKKRKK